MIAISTTSLSKSWHKQNREGLEQRDQQSSSCSIQANCFELSFGGKYDNKDQKINYTIVWKSFGWASHHSRKTHLYHVTHDEFPGQELAVTKQSFKVKVSCMNPDNIFEDSCPPSATKASLPQEDPNIRLRESRTNAEPSVQVPTRWGLSASEVTELQEQGSTVDGNNEALPENIGAESLSAPAGTRTDHWSPPVPSQNCMRKIWQGQVVSPHLVASFSVLWVQAIPDDFPHGLHPRCCHPCHQCTYHFRHKH